MITVEQAVKTTINRFVYKSDGSKDNWSFLDDDVPTIYGDCEDFSFAVMRLFFGSIRATFKALWRKEAKLYYCRVYSQGSYYGHAIGEINGKFFDNAGVTRYGMNEFHYVIQHSVEPCSFAFIVWKFAISWFRS